MMITNEQRTILQGILDRGPNSQGNYADAYALIFSWIGSSDQVDDNVKLWFMGAIQANAGKGTFSALIREYSSTQMALRGVGYSGQLMQDASNRVAERAIREILRTNSFPDIDTIADADAIGVGEILFASLGAADTAGKNINAGWAGTILFHAFDSQQIGRLLTAGDSASAPGFATQLNRLDDIKNLLFAYYAYEKAILKAAAANIELITDLDINQWLIDLGINELTFAEAVTANNLNKNFVTLLDANISRHLVGDAKKFGELIEDIGTIGEPGVEHALAWLMSTLEGKAVPIESGKFIENSVDFFSRFSAEELQSKSVQFISDPMKLAEMAKTDVNARAALAGLSPLVMEVSADVAAALTLFDPKTGQGEITEQWINDRALALAAFLNHWRTNGPATDVGAEFTVFNDVASGQEVQTFSFAAADIVKYVAFGSSGNDIISGGKKDDRLYGGTGADNLNAGDGNDYIEGNAGNDSLTGGEGVDILLGGADKDTLDGGTGNDILKGGGGDDTYRFTGVFGRDVINDNAGKNTLDVNGVVTSFTQLAKDSAIYYDDINNPTRKAVVVDEGNTQSLIISTVTKSGLFVTDSGNSITIKNWNESNFNITLKNAAELTPDTEKVFTVNGNVNDNALSLNNAGDTNPNYGVMGYVTVNANGGAGNDLIMGLSTGKDTLIGGDGDDVISSGFTEGISGSAHMRALDVPGIDSISGGKGNDYIVASALAVAHGDDGDDVLRADTTLYAVMHGAERDKKWNDLLQFKEHITEQKDASGTSQFTVGLTFKKNLTAEFKEFTSADGSKFIAKHDRGTTTIGYNYKYLDGQYYYNALEGWEFNERDIIPGGGTYESSAKMQGVSLFGDAGNDFLMGGLRSDYLSGGADKDTIAGGEGQDVIDGGQANDLLMGSEGDDLIMGGEGDDTLFGSQGGARADASDNDVLYGGSGSDQLNGGAGKDYLEGGTGRDTLHGEEGDDYLYGGDDQEEDFLIGGAGNDTIVMGLHDQADGGTGDNIYIWNPREVANTIARPVAFTLSGNTPVAPASAVSRTVSSQFTTSTTAIVVSDIIKNTEGNNTLGIAGLSNLNDAAITTSGKYLVITTGNKRRIAIEDGATNTPVKIAFGRTAEQLANTPLEFSSLSDEHFLNGVAPLDQSQITTADLMLAKLENVAVLQGGASQYLAGGLNKDVLTANISGSTLIGGKGADNLLGDIGNDTYLIRKGDGNDTIIEKGGSNHIKFDQAISIAQTTVRRNGTDLIFTIAEDQHLTVKNMFDARGAVVAQSSISNVTFYGGASNTTVWDLAQLKQHALASTAADDNIFGFDGDDTYYYSLGNGRDVVTDGSGNDTIQLGAGITQAQVIVRKDINNNLILSFADGGSITVANAFNSAGEFTANAIESIKFADKSIWNLTRLEAEVAKDLSHTFKGTTSDDAIIGSAAKDILAGGKGNDTLAGGLANDVYQYALGDGNDVVIDTGGVDKIHFIASVKQSEVVARSNGKDLTLTLADGAVLTVKDMFVTKVPNVVDPLITAIIHALETRWIPQTEALIEKHFGLVGKGNLELDFERDVTAGNVASLRFKESADGQTLEPVLTINLENVTDLPDGSAPYYYDRLIAYELTHAVLANNVDLEILPGWFVEGATQFIQGADERVKAELSNINTQHSLETLFNTDVGYSSTSAGYAVSYIAVKFLDNEIRANGGTGIHEIFDRLKNGKTIDQALASVSALHNGMNGLWDDLFTFESHFKATGLASISTLLNLNNADTGSIAGSDYGNTPLDAKSVIPDIYSGAPKHFNLVIPTQFVAVGNEHNEIETIQFSDGSVWDAERIRQEVIKGNLIGTPGNDFISGTSGDDNLRGYGGNDQIHGGSGNDVYFYALDDGSDTIHDVAGTDTVQFGDGILSDNVRLQREDKDVVISLTGGNEITIKNFIDANGNLASGAIEQLKFSSGESWDTATIKSKLIKVIEGTKESDSLRGSFENDLIRGFAGNDVIYGSYGDDTLDGGAGNDYIEGGAGADTYIFSIGYGADSINNGTDDSGISGAHADTVQFLEPITAINAVVSREDDNLKIGIKGKKDSLLVQNYFSEEGTTHYAVENLKFHDGTLWDVNYVKEQVLIGTSSNDKLYGYARADSLNGYAGNDTIFGGGGNDSLEGGSGDDVVLGGDGADVITGGIGNDTLYGGYGADTYFFEVGYGHDWITTEYEDDASRNIDTILFEGIAPNDIKLSAKSYYGNLSLVISTNEGKDSLTVDNYFVYGESGLYPIKQIKFSNGVTWDTTAIKQRALASTDGQDYIYGYSSNDVISGAGGNDEINGYAGNDSLRGDSGKDTLSGGTGDDTLNGGTGDDQLLGGDGNNVYVFELGSGQDTIYLSQNDTLKFGAGIRENELTFLNFYNNQIVIKVNDSGDSVVAPIDFLMGKITFSDGTIWNGETLKGLISNALVVENLAVNGTTGNETLKGSFGNDTLNGGAGNDTLDGGFGNDNLDGGRGNDVYIFSKDSGHDVIFSNDTTANKVDTIQVTEGLSPSDIVIRRSDESLILIANDSIASLTIERYFRNDATSGYKIERIAFATGEIWDIAYIKAAVLVPTEGNDTLHGYATNDTFYSGSGNDVIFAGAGDDVLDGGAGADVLDGAVGSDTYIFGRGYGSDTIRDTFGQTGTESNVLQLGEGIVIGDLLFERRGFEELVISIKGTTDNILIPQYFSSNGNLSNRLFDIIRFSNGTSLSFDQVELITRTGTSADDRLFSSNGRPLYGLEGNDYLASIEGSIFGGDGDDSLHMSGHGLLDGGAGDDTLASESELSSGKNIYVGGLGNDLISDRGGHDTYRFNLGDGVDEITDKSGIDTLEFGSGITANDLIVTNKLSHVEITFKNSPDDKITFWEWNLDQRTSYIDGKIETIKFFDGTSLSFDDAPLLDKIAPWVSADISLHSDALYISGRTELSAVALLHNASGVLIGSDDTDTIDGYFSFSLDKEFSTGQSLFLTVRDTAGNISDPVVLKTLDKLAPLQPTAAFDAAGKVITGIAEAGSTVSVKNNANTTTLGTGTADEVTGAYSVVLATALINNQTVNVIAKDAAGNMSTARSIIAPDLTAPAIPSAIIDAAGKVITGTAEKGSTVIVKNAAGMELKTGVADTSTGAYNVTLTTALINKESLSIVAKDISGNVSSAKVIIAPDKTPPAAPSAQLNSARKIISGTAEAGSVVNVLDANDVPLKSVTANGTTGYYSITLTTAVPAGQGVKVTATDKAGNISPPTTIGGPITPMDTTPPEVPSAQFDSTGAIITGKAEVGSLVEVKNATTGSLLGKATANMTGDYSVALSVPLINKEIVKVTATDAAGNMSAASLVEAPYAALQSPTAITIQAESYTSMSGVQKENTSDVGGGQNVGYIDPGDWMSYDNIAFNVPIEGRYKVTYRVSSLNGGARFTLKESSNDSVLGLVDIPKTGAWTKWIDVTEEITLSGGVHNFKVAVEAGKFNINWFRFEPLESVELASSSVSVDSENRVILGEIESDGFVTNQDSSVANVIGATAYATDNRYAHSIVATQKTSFAAREMAEVADYEGLQSYNNNDALIQAMASFSSGGGADKRYGTSHLEENHSMISVGS